MPFEKVGTLPTNPAVRVFFTGLMVLEGLPLPQAPQPQVKKCEVFVHNSGLDHNLSVEVRRKRTGKPDAIMMRLLAPLSATGLDNPPRHGLHIRTVRSIGEPKGIKSFDGTTSSTEGARLRDAFNLTTIHDVPPGPVKLAGGLPSIILDDATFYTADFIARRVEIVKKDGTKTITLTQVPSIIGANIYLDPTEKVTLTWRQYGRDINLNLPQSSSFTYEIYINNEPLYEDDSITAPFKHDEFDEYYKILNVPEPERYKLIFPDQDPPPDRGSTRTPCMSVILDE